MKSSTRSDPHVFALKDGRQLGWCEYGDPSGRPLLLQHGTPGSVLQVRGLDEVARNRGWRVIAVERAGMGVSSSHAEASNLTAADDALQLLRSLNVTDVVTAGISGGAAPALAMASLDPQLITGVVLVAGMLPINDGFAADMGTSHHVLYRLASVAPGVLALAMGALYRASFRKMASEAGAPAVEGPLEDKRVLEIHGARFAEDLQRATQQGARASVEELRVMRKGGEVDWQRISCPVIAVHGDQDHNVPLSVAHNAARLLQHCTVRVLPGRGHLFLLQEPDALLDAAEALHPVGL